jgi:single-strand DNA-binding protein
VPKSLNRVMLIGNIGKDPEIKHTPSGTPVARISLATNERFKDKAGEWKDRTEWHTVILWSRLAEIAGEYLQKGSKIFIEGRLQTRSWQKDDATKYATEVIVEELIMLDSKKPEDAKTAAAAAGRDTSPITDEDIPF